MNITTGTYVFVVDDFGDGFLRLSEKNWYTNVPLGWDMASTRKISELEAEYQEHLEKNK